MRHCLLPLPLLAILAASRPTYADDWFLPAAPAPADAPQTAAAPTGAVDPNQSPPATPTQPVTLTLPSTLPPTRPSPRQPAAVTVPAAAPFNLPIRLPRLTLDVGAAATMPNSDNPPPEVSLNLLGGNPANALPITVGGSMAYGTPVDVRVPEHQLGVHAAYILSPNTQQGMPQISIGASFGVNTYGPTETNREGTATLHIGF